MVGVIVKGGTNAGRRRVKQPDPWSCDCVELHEHELRVYRQDGSLAAAERVEPRGPFRSYRLHTGYSCPDCGKRRP